jgi:4-hydroxybenzoate polyprenyltransferase
MSLSFSSRFLATIKLLRPFQYYKNILIFLGIIFSKQIAETSYWIPLLMGFVALCATSSVNYVINDLRDAEKDKLHPEKKSRPIASGKVSKPLAIIIAILLAVIAITLIVFMPISLIVRVEFLLIASVIFVTSQLYSFYFKQIIFADISFIAINYVWRAVSGCIIVQATISPWLILLSFLFALLLALAKRKGDLLLMEGNESEGIKHRKVLQDYNLPLVNQGLSVLITTMLVSYSLFTFEGDSIVGETAVNPVLNQYFALMTIPFVAFILLRYLFLLENGEKVSRRAELLFLDKQIMIAGFCAGLLLLISIYIDISFFVLAFQELPLFQ